MIFFTKKPNLKKKKNNFFFEGGGEGVECVWGRGAEEVNFYYKEPKSNKN